jgi:DNA-binding transcriptional LysR family regulator
MEDLNDLYYFAQVVDHGGFAAASRAVGLPKSTLSRRISALEERLGARLLQRSTRQFSVTDVGRTFYAHCKAMLVEAEAAEEAITLSRSEPRGIVRVSCPIALLQTNIGVMVADFLAENPLVEIRLSALNRPVDVIGEGFDLAIRVRRPPLEDSDLVLRVFSERKQCLVASPSLVEALGAPLVPTDLARFPSLGRGAVGENRWELCGPAGAEAKITYQPRLTTDDMVALCTAAVRGVGVVHLPLMMVRRELERRELVRLLPDWAPRPEIVHAVLPSKRCVLPAVRALVDFLTLRFKKLDEE